MPNAPLVQPQDLCDYLGLTQNLENFNRLASVCEFASSWLLAKIGRDFEQTTRTDVLRGNGTKFLVLRNYPVASLTSITVQDGTLTTTIDVTNNLEVDLEDAQNGIIVRTNGDKWPKQPYRNITVVYVGGPTSVPDYLSGAALELAAYLYQTTGGRLDVSTPEGHVSFINLANKGFLGLPAVMNAITQSQDVVYSTDDSS